MIAAAAASDASFEINYIVYVAKDRWYQGNDIRAPVRCNRSP